MLVIHNGKEEILDDTILNEKWKIKSVYGLEEAQKPGLCLFNNTSKALKLLDRHIKMNNLIVLHTDVDVDGIGTTYIVKKALEYLGSKNHLLLINKDKIHGLQQKHAEYFKDKQVGLVLVTDSSCNELEIIKQFNCDVLCIDHHELNHTQLYGKCNNDKYEYVIVNNTISSSTYEEDIGWLEDSSYIKYEAEPNMSCGLVAYELLRVYCKYLGYNNLLENLKLYQWAGITLFTDVIDTLNERNQWYLHNTVFSNEIEQSLGIMMREINRFKVTLDKSYIQYSFAPIINKAIRAGKSSEVVDKVINKPGNICDLNIYNQIQIDAIEKATKLDNNKLLFNDEYAMLDISSIGVHPNYSGVIASRICGDNNKNTAVFTRLTNGKCKGSFRGRYKGVDYRKYFNDYAPDVYAQGHPPAFGFELEYQQLTDLMSNIKSIEPLDDERVFITIGSVDDAHKGIYHVVNVDEFKKQGFVWKIAIGNAKVVAEDEILIGVSAKDVVLKETKGKLYVYDVLGFECKAFKPLEGNFFNIYFEYGREINSYIR